MLAKPRCLILDPDRQLGPEWAELLRQYDLHAVTLAEPDALSQGRGVLPRLIIVAGHKASSAATRLHGMFPGVPILIALDGRSTSHETASDAPEGRIIGGSVPMQRARSQLLKISRSDVNVLISGESGTGKELAAALVHEKSQRRDGPFVCVNCAAIPDSLIESELFGFQKGAFTGADRPGEGKFCEADGGTIFLDEIGDMSVSAQAKVLRTIETKQIHRLGGKGGKNLSVRIIAATNRNLAEMAAHGSFRSDLYFRLKVAEVELPPLRERTGDIPQLVDHYVREFNELYSLSLDGLSDELLQLFVRYRWPGNVRELRNVLEAAYINEPHQRISIADLSLSFRQSLEKTHTAPQPDGERERVLAALRSTNWNKSKAAESLQWSRVTLYRKIAQHHLSEYRWKKESDAIAPLFRAAPE